MRAEPKEWPESSAREQRVRKGGPDTSSSPSNPYGALDPTAPEPGAGAPLIREAGWPSVLLRGARKRCPRCGERRIWDGWFALKVRCPRCDLRFEAELGGFLGA